MDKAESMGQGANNSSDFVRKLYKMLEDPAHGEIVRWGESGESFVVLENEKFTKNILPKHFKHSNFASFVRQLNKYDFHKVRQTNEDNGPNPYGANAWEFHHPEFQANKKDSLDNIKRKAPAPRKSARDTEDSISGQQMDFVNSQLAATQQQLQLLTERYQDLAQGHVVLLQQVVQLQKFVKNHDGALHRVMTFLNGVDTQRRSSRIAFPGSMPGEAMGSEVDDNPASPLLKAAQLLDEYSVDNLPNKELEQMTQEYYQRNDYSTPPTDQSSSMGQPRNPRTQIGYGVGSDLDTMVYPVGHTNGIDPINSEHINNIPYSLPANGMIPVEPMPHMMTAEDSTGAVTVVPRKKSAQEQKSVVWGPIKPRILLVEDDKVCSRIGSKFLQSFECGVETADDGLQAVNKLNHGHGHFDLILMDIIMPHLDGISATCVIRESRPDIPIIAMTSNIRADDIDMYFRYGMQDVLPKPFTKEGMLRALEKHLPQFKKDAPMPPHMSQDGMQQPRFVAPGATQTPLGFNMGQLSGPQSLKDDTSPGKSPVTVTSWNSPNQISGQSPLGNPTGPFMQQQPQMQQQAMQQIQQQQPQMQDPNTYTMSPHPQAHPHPQSVYSTPQGPIPIPALNAPPRASGAHRRVMSDMTGSGGPQDEHPDVKRQRMYPPGAFQ